jgi:hypothetical protein
MLAMNRATAWPAPCVAAERFGFGFAPPRLICSTAVFRRFASPMSYPPRAPRLPRPARSCAAGRLARCSSPRIRLK